MARGEQKNSNIKASSMGRFRRASHFQLELSMSVLTMNTEIRSALHEKCSIMHFSYFKLSRIYYSCVVNVRIVFALLLYNVTIGP